MSQSTNQPLPIKIKLASTPKENPVFSVTCSLDSGEKAEFADPKATRAMVALMDMEAVIGGAASHYGGPAAFAELMSAAYGVAFDRAKKQNKDIEHLKTVITKLSNQEKLEVKYQDHQQTNWRLE